MPDKPQAPLAQHLERLHQSARSLAEGADKLKESSESIRGALQAMQVGAGEQAAQAMFVEFQQAAATTATEALERIRESGVEAARAVALDVALANRPLDPRLRRPGRPASQAPPEVIQAGRQYAQITRYLRLKGLAKFEATTPDPRSVNLVWTVWPDEKEKLREFTLSRCEGVNCTNFAEIKKFGPGAIEYVDEPLDADKTYRYRLTASDLRGEDWTAVAEAKTKGLKGDGYV